MAVVTISRQSASLGDEIAQGLAEDLGYHLVSREDIHQLAASYDNKFRRDLERLEDERGMSLLERLFFGQPAYASLYAAVIMELASRRQTIILGRGAQVVLRHVPQVLRARVVAPREVRTQRVMDGMGLDYEHARAWLAQHDQLRRSLINQIFDHDLRNWALYHLVLNTETMDVAGGVRILRQAVDEVKRLHPMDEVAVRLKDLALGKHVEALVRRKVLNSMQLMADGDAGGRVILHGGVPSEADKKEAEHLAQGVEGVTEVDNQLRTAGVTFRWPA